MRRLIVPVLLLGAAIAADRLGIREELPPALLLNLGRTVFAAVFLLAWRFRRGRTAWAVAMIALAAEAARAGWWPREDAASAAVLLLIPASLAVLGFLRDWRVAGWAGLWRWAVLGAETAAVWALGRDGFEFLEPVREALTSESAFADPRLAFAAGGIALAAALARRGTSIEAGLLATLAAVFAALALPAAAGYYLAVAGLVLGLSLVENAFSLAFEDGLTGLPARRALEETLVHLGGAYAIAMVDLDHFKKVNDRHGHEVGDQVLQMVASKLARLNGGQAFRYGGEEFSVVFAGKTAAEAEPVLEELRRSLAETAFTVRSPSRPKKKPKAKSAGAKSSKTGAGARKLRVTVSIGLAQKSERNRLPEQVMKAADKALYRSKKAGRNRVTVGR